MGTNNKELLDSPFYVGYHHTRVRGEEYNELLEETIRESLPEDFQSSEYSLEHGMVDMVVPRHQIRDTLIRLIGLLRQPRPDADIVALTADSEIETVSAAPEGAET